jgi:hypothetical protein
MFYRGPAGSKIKEAKIILRNIYYSLPSKNSISLEVGEETKLLPDSAFGNSLCTSAFKPKSEKNCFFPGLPPPLETEIQSRDDPTGSQICPGTLKRFKTTPSS